MVSPRLLAALSYRLCCAREAQGSDKAFFAEKHEAFGRVPLVVLTGDFMQLPPFDAMQRVSLMVDPRPGPPNTGDKDYMAKQGYDLFWRCLTDVVVLKKTYRFRDKLTGEECSVLPRLFAYMRDPRSVQEKGALPAELWAHLQSMVVKDAKDARLHAPRCKAGY